MHPLDFFSGSQKYIGSIPHHRDISDSVCPPPARLPGYCHWCFSSPCRTLLSLEICMYVSTISSRSFVVPHRNVLCQHARFITIQILYKSNGVVHNEQELPPQLLTHTFGFISIIHECRRRQILGDSSWSQRPTDESHSDGPFDVEGVEYSGNYCPSFAEVSMHHLPSYPWYCSHSESTRPA